MRWPLLGGTCGAVLIALGGLAYQPVPAHSWVKNWAALNQLRHQPWHAVLGGGVGVVGLVLLTGAWWLLRSRVRGRPDGVRIVRWTVAAWSVPLLFAPPLFSGDAWSYVATGYLTGHGLSPYVVGPGVLHGAISSAVGHRWLHTPTPYGPLPLLWGGAFSRLTADPWALMVLYRVLALIGLALVAWAVPRIAARCHRDPAAASALVVASPLVVAHGVGGLHNDMLMAGLMLAALAVTRREVWWWGALLTGAAASVKVTGGLVGIGVVLLSVPVGAGPLSRFRRTVEVGVVSVGMLLVAGLVSGLGVGWLRGLLVPAHERTLLAPTMDAAWHLRAVLVHAGPVGHHLLALLRPTHTVFLFDAALLVALAAWILYDRRFRATPEAFLATGVLLFAATWLSPVMHYWYFLWCVPLLGCVRLPRWAMAGLLTLVVVLGLTAPADADLRSRMAELWAHRALAVLPLVAIAFSWRRSRGGGPGPRAPVRPAV